MRDRGREGQADESTLVVDGDKLALRHVELLERVRVLGVLDVADEIEDLDAIYLVKRSSFSSSSRDTICAERIEGDLVLCTTGAGFINSEGGSITTLPGLPQLREPACVVT